MDEQENIQQAQQPIEQPKHDKAAPQPKEKTKHNWVARIFGGDVLQSEFVLRQKWLILLICVFALMLVYNRYRVEDLTKAKIEAQERINYLRESRIELQKRYQETIKISKIAEMLDSTGVGITAGPPYEI
ncbi:MAG: hypothetical protein IKK04_03460 [Bacteroidales bacterium]|jgi:hypothetical protein|nr:hypothetical protein [Bacteroidales bacterium]